MYGMDSKYGDELQPIAVVDTDISEGGGEVIVNNHIQSVHENFEDMPTKRP